MHFVLNLLCIQLLVNKVSPQTLSFSARELIATLLWAFLLPANYAPNAPVSFA